MGTAIALAVKLGAIFKAAIGTAPDAVAAATRNGTAVDRMTPGGYGFLGATLIAATGPETGSPTGRTLDAKIQDSADGSTGWADYIPPGQATVAAVAQITAVNTLKEVDVNLEGAKRYIRVVEVVTLTAGTSPKIGAQTTLVLYGADRMPV